MPIRAFSLILIFCSALAVACSHQPNWHAPYYQAHSLVGTIWRISDNQEVSEATLMTDLAAAKYVFLGETHDNPDHHYLQAHTISQLKNLGRAPAVGFEMFSASQTSALAEHLATHPGNSIGIGNAVGWARSGWPDWSFYEPIARAALDAKLPLFAANADAADIRRIARGETLEFSLDDKGRFAINVSIPTGINVSLRQEIAEAHCGYATPDMITGMSRAQWVRDTYMAASVTNAAGSNGAVLILGTGHARRDRGVPFHLTNLHSEQQIVSVAFLEATPEREELESYAEAFHSETLPFDYVWFTPKVDVRDPCERFAEELKSISESKNGDSGE